MAFHRKAHLLGNLSLTPLDLAVHKLFHAAAARADNVIVMIAVIHLVSRPV